MVMPFIGAANRDPAQFPDPDRLDIAPHRQPPHRLRLGHPLLPRRAARAPGGPDRHQHAAAADAQARARHRRAAASAEPDPARPDVAARLLLTPLTQPSPLRGEGWVRGGGHVMNVGVSVPLPAYLVDVGRHGPQGRGARLRVLLVRRAPFHPRAHEEPLSRLARRGDPGELLALRGSLRRARARLRRHQPHQARHRNRAGAGAASAGARQGGVDPRSLQRGPLPLRHRRGVATRGDGDHGRRLRPSLDADPRVGAGHEGVLDQAGGGVPRQVLRLPAGPLVSEARAEAASAGDSGRRRSQRIQANVEWGDGWLPTRGARRGARGARDARSPRQGGGPQSRVHHDLGARAARGSRPRPPALRRGRDAGGHPTRHRED